VLARDLDAVIQAMEARWIFRQYSTWLARRRCTGERRRGRISR
jgi:hypothetical protein